MPMQKLHRVGEMAWMSTACRWLTTNSKSKQINRVRGTRDVQVDELQHHREVLQVLQQTVEGCGFRSVRLCNTHVADVYRYSYTEVFFSSDSDAIAGIHGPVLAVAGRWLRHHSEGVSVEIRGPLVVSTERIVCRRCTRLRTSQARALL